MHSDALAPIGAASFGHWEFSVLTLATTAVVALLYLFGLQRLKDKRDPLPRWRAVSFVLGLLVLVFTLASAIDRYAMALFWVHMVEHLILIMVVPTFLILGRPLTVMSAALGRGPQPWGRIISATVHPIVALTLYSAVIIGTHLTGFMDSMSMNGDLMTLEQVGYVVAGLILMEAMIGTEPVRWRLPYAGRLLFMLVSMVPDTLVGIVLMQSTSTPFPMYLSMRPDWALDAHRDVTIAGGLMWAGGDGLMMLMGLGVVAAAIWGPSRGDLLGERLNRIRHQTMVEHLEAAGVDSTTLRGSDTDDDSALKAYNEMLARLSRQDEAGR